MPLAVKDVDTLKRYIEGVMHRAEHHAGNVGGAALALAGAIVWRKDDAEEIEVMEREGDLKNVLWVRIGGRRYAFSYNHKHRAIEMREGTTHGPVLYKFTNGTSTHNVETIFRAL
jgi:Integron cassette protein VCH_CASS1 chain